MSTTTAAATLSFNGNTAIVPVPAIAALHGKNAPKIAARFSRAVTENLAKWGLAAGTATVTMPDGTSIDLHIEWHAPDNGDVNNCYPGRWAVGGGVGQFNATLQKAVFAHNKANRPA